jgi:hypothetical protein
MKSSQKSSHPYRDRLHFVALFLFILSGCGGEGCSCMTPLPNGFPAELRQPNAAQARLSESGLTFVENNIGSLAGSLLPGGTTFNIPPACSGSTPACCSDGSGDTCRLSLDLVAQPGDSPRLELTPSAPNKLGLVVRARVKSLDPITVKVLASQCDVGIDTTATGDNSVKITAALTFKQDAAPDGAGHTLGTTVVDMDPASVVLENLDDGDVSFKGHGGIGDDIGCGFIGIFKGIIVGQVKSIFTSKISELVSGLLCKKCDSDGDCAPFATCGGGGTCEIPGSNPVRCLQELGVSGRIAASNVLAGISPGLTGALDLYLVAGGYVQAGGQNGMSLGLLGSANPADGAHNSCVPFVAAPPLEQIPESTLLKGNTRPDGAGFDLGIGVHKQFLDRALWSAYDSGFLCLNVGTRSVELLNTDTFANIMVPSLADLLGRKISPVVLALRPQQPPTFDIDEGTFADGHIAKPLLTLNMKNVEFDLFAQVDERFVRVFTVAADMAMPIGLLVNEEGKLVPTLPQDASTAFSNVHVTNSELLDETQQAIADKFPAVLSIAVPILAANLQPIAPPAVAGMNLGFTPGSLTGIENNSMLGVFAQLSVGSTKPAVAQVDTTARVARVVTPATAVFSRPGKLQAADRPRVELELGSDARDVEYQLQVDGAPWSPWTTRRELTLSQDGFWLQGRHKILVRARAAGVPESVDPTPVELDAIIDSIAPGLTLTDEGEAVLVDATDTVSPAEALVIEYRFGDDADWRVAGAAPPVAIEVAGKDLATLEVRVKDEAGNVTSTSGEQAGFHGRAPAGSGCDCRIGSASSTGMPRGVWLIGALGMVGLVIAVRRRRGSAQTKTLVTVAVVALVAVMAGACGGSASGDDDDDDDDDDVPADGLQPGALGRYLDMASDDGRVVIVGYEEKYGDLVFTEVSSSGSISPEPVDGVPEGAPVVDNPEGYRGGVDDEGENVGAFASVALVGGNARVAYQHLDDHTLLYGGEAGGGAWARHVVDPAADGEVAGLYNSLSVDAGGVPGIAYMATRVPDGAGGFKSQLRWAQAANASPASESDWSITVVAEAAIPCAGLCDAATEACVASTNQCAPMETTCSATCSDTEECVGGACVAIVKPPAVEDLPEGPGLFASAGRLPSGDPVIAFYDRTAGDLKLATFSAGTWSLLPVAVDTQTDMGQWASLIVGGDGVVRIAFQDALADSLRYVEVNGTEVGDVETIDDGQRDDRPHPVGAGAALFFDGSATLSVVYQDAATNDLLLAQRGSSGWTHDDFLTGEIGYGFYNAAVVDGSTTWVATFGYDRAKFPPGQVFVEKMP